jgi:hypothetical protein
VPGIIGFGTNLPGTINPIANQTSKYDLGRKNAERTKQELTPPRIFTDKLESSNKEQQEQ